MITVALQNPLKRTCWNFRSILAPEISILQLRNPVIKDFYDLDFQDQKSLVQNNVILIHRLSELPIKTVENLSPPDFVNVMNAINASIDFYRGGK